jgi:aspartate-semialdehyde dehydrogenase
MIELRRQSQAVLDKKEVSPSTFPWQIAFNLLPQVGEFLDDGDTETERDAAQEVKDILNLPNLAITITCIRVPVFVCHSLAINVELKNDFSIPRIREILRGFPGVRVLDDAQSGIYPKPGDLADRDEVFVGRIRRDQTVPYGVNLWSVSDNLRKGSALNAVQIAEILVEWLEGD